MRTTCVAMKRAIWSEPCHLHAPVVGTEMQLQNRPGCLMFLLLHLPQSAAVCCRRMLATARAAHRSTLFSLPLKRWLLLSATALDGATQERASARSAVRSVQIATARYGGIIAAMPRIHDAAQ
jgi:hypothetical protein